MLYRHTNPFKAGTFARGEDVNFKFDEIEAAFARLTGARLIMERNYQSAFNMDGNSYGKMLVASFDAPQEGRADTYVTIGKGVVDYGGQELEIAGAVMFLCNDSDGHVYVQAGEGVTLTGGSDRLYQRGSIVAFLAMSENEWFCAGDFAEPELYP